MLLNTEYIQQVPDMSRIVKIQKLRLMGCWSCHGRGIRKLHSAPGGDEGGVDGKQLILLSVFPDVELATGAFHEKPYFWDGK